MKHMSSLGAKFVAIAGAGALALTAFGPAAAAATVTSSSAEARFLTGSGGGTNFDEIAALEGVSAKQSGKGNEQTNANSLKASLLKQQIANQADGLNIPIDQLVKLGAVNQYAQASPDGKSRAASGAVANGGAINTTASKKFPSNATLDLSTVGLPTQVTDQLADLKLDIGAASAVAALDAKQGQELATKCAQLSDPSQCRDYRIAGANVHFGLPVLKTLMDQLRPVADEFKAKTVDASSICNAATGTPLETILKPLCAAADDNPALVVEATPPDLNKIAAAVTDVGSGKGLDIDLQNGTVDLDLAKFLKYLGLDINNLPPSTDLVDYIVKAISENLPGILNSMVTNLTDKVQTELEKSSITLWVGGTKGTKITIPASDLSSILNPIIAQLMAAAATLTTQLEDGSKSFVDAAKQLRQLITITANVQDSPSKGVFRETALQIKLLNIGLPNGSRSQLGTAAPTAGLELNLARAQVGSNEVGTTATPTNEHLSTGSPIKDMPSTSDGVNLPNTGAGVLDLPFLLLGLALVTGGGWIIMFGRSEHLESEPERF